MRRCIYFLSAILFLGFAFPASARAASYYVAAGGNDTNPGTQASPWKTIQKSANTMIAGDTVFVQSGTYYTNPITDPQVQVTTSGAAGAPITYQAQGTVQMPGFIVSADYITIKGFTAASLADSPIGILVNKGGWCDIENNTVEFNAMGGISLQGLPSNPAATHDCVVKNNTIFRNGMYGLEIMGQNHLVENNDISYTIQHSPCHAANEPWLDADGIRFFGGGHKFIGNRIHDIPFGPPGMTTTSCSLANLANLNNDYVLDSHTDCFQTFNGGGDHVAGHDILFNGNSCLLLNDGGGSGTTKGFQLADGTHNLTITNNILHAKLMMIFNSGNVQSHDLTVLNNTFVGYPNDPTSWGIEIMSTNYLTTNINIQNNIFAYQENGLGSIKVDNPTTNQTATIGHNCVYRATGHPSRPVDPGDVWGVDPLFVNISNITSATGNDYHLQANSPCNGMGAYAGGNPPTTISPSVRPGDLNGDGKVDIFDFNLLVTDFGKTGTPGFSVADIDKNGKVDIFDFNILVGNFGK